MDKLLFLMYCFSNALVYSLVKFLHIKSPEYSTIEVMGYINLFSLLLMTPYLMMRFRKIARSFNANLKLSLAAPASLLKIYCIQFISPANAMVVSFLIPSIVTFLSFITLKEFDKKHTQKYLWLLVSFAGVAIFVGPTFRDYSTAYALLLVHVLLKGLINVFLKQLSEDRYVTLFYATLQYALFAIGTFFWYNKFSFSMIFQPGIMFVGIVSVLCQLCWIYSYKIASKISLLQNLDYSRMIFICIIAYFLFGDVPNINQVIGISVVIISIILSQVKGFDRYNIITLGLGKQFEKNYNNYRRRAKIIAARRKRRNSIIAKNT